MAFGTAGRSEVEIPFNTPADYRARIFIDDGSDLRGRNVETVEFDAVDHYELQGERFAEAVRGVGSVPVPLEDALGNMAVIEALFRSTESRRWETPAR
ncbi:MAG: hypothetical protein AAB224_01735 [Gemmatimonadota bacterium]